MANPVLDAGSTAPDFTLPSADGDVTLSSLRGRPVVVYFYPRDNTPGCTNEACDFRDRLEDLASHGATVLGISPDSVASHEKFAAQFDLNFALLADTDREVAKAWGVLREKTNYGRTFLGIVRSTFLIDADGVVQRVWDNVKVRRKLKGGERKHVDDVADALAELVG